MAKFLISRFSLLMIFDTHLFFDFYAYLRFEMIRQKLIFIILLLRVPTGPCRSHHPLD
jgi:hypothetical protein